MSKTEIRIRPGEKREIPDIESIGVEAYAQYESDVPASVFSAYMEDLRRLRHYWSEAEVLVAELDNRIAGCVLFYPDASTEGLGLPAGWAGFRKLAVRPELRGRLVGRKLVEGCVERARELGAPTIGIHTVSFMTAACRLYEQTGFRRCSRYDLTASDVVGIDDGRGEVEVLAYRLDLSALKDTGDANSGAGAIDVLRRP